MASMNLKRASFMYLSTPTLAWQQNRCAAQLTVEERGALIVLKGTLMRCNDTNMHAGLIAHFHPVRVVVACIAVQPGRGKVGFWEDPSSIEHYVHNHGQEVPSGPASSAS
jgi:hypothetical protein